MTPEIQTQEEISIDMPSYNHALVQSNLAAAFRYQYREKYHALTQPTLKLNDWESEPDLAIFPKRIIDWVNDEIKITEVPLLVIEIISPRQATQDIALKCKQYFAEGVSSCWVINPIFKTIHVYSPDWTYQLYGAGSDKIKDNTLQVEIEFEDIFS